MRVDARDLRRDVGAHAHGLARDLVHHLEGTQLEIVSGAGEEGVHVFEERRHDQLVFLRKKQIQDGAPQPLDPLRLRREDVLHVLGQQPLHDRAQTRSSRPTMMEERPTKRIWPSVICVMRRNVSRQSVGATKGSTPSSTSISAKAMRNKLPWLIFSGRLAARASL